MKTATKLKIEIEEVLTWILSDLQDISFEISALKQLVDESKHDRP